MNAVSLYHAAQQRKQRILIAEYVKLHKGVLAEIGHRPTLPVKSSMLPLYRATLIFVVPRTIPMYIEASPAACLLSGPQLLFASSDLFDN